MSVNIGRLADKIYAIADDYDAITPEGKDDARRDFADKLATAIVEEILELKIIYTSGLVAAGNPVGGVLNHTTS